MRRSLWVVALTLLASGARADSKATAEALYEQGKALLKEGNYAAACPKFAASNEAEPSMGALLHLADCQEKRGQLASAWATFREAVSFSTRTKDDRRKIAEDRSKSLESRLPRLVIASASQAPGLQVKRDGEIVSPASFGTPLPVDPGERKIEATAPKKKPYLGAVTLKEGQTLTVQIPELADEAPTPVASVAPTAPAASVAPPASSAPVAPEAPAAPPSGWTNRKTLGVGLGAAGLVGLGLGTYFGLNARSKWNDSRPLCEGTRCSHEGAVLAGDARTSGTVSTVSFVIGAAALGAGAYFFLSKGDSGAVQVGATASPSGGLLAIEGIY